MLLLWLSACGAQCPDPCLPCPDPDVSALGNTNLDSLVLTNDLTVGDDVLITDDMQVGDGLTVVGDTSTAGLTATGATNLDGGLAMDTNKFTVANTSGNVATAGTVTVAYDIEHLRLPSIMSETIITSTNGALWTVGASEVWYVHACFCHVTTNFDCDGDDCVLNIGDGNDADGLLDLDDGELQTADTEGTGAAAGWQGFMSGDTAGAYLVNGVGFIYAAADTIDITIEDASAHTDPTAGAATCYLVYTRLE